MTAAVLSKSVWTFGFLVGTTTHMLDLIHYGWLPYDFRPLPWNIYWTSLTFLDLLAALLIWVREDWGILLGAAIMGSNVLVNGYTAFVIGREEFFPALALQIAFALFVFWMTWRHWQGSKEAAASR